MIFASMKQFIPFSHADNMISQSAARFLESLKFDLEKSKVKVMGEVKGQGHIVYPVSNQCTSFLFNINRTNHSCDMSNRVFDLEKNPS